MYERRLTQGEHTRRFRITILDLSGWEVVKRPTVMSSPRGSTRTGTAWSGPGTGSSVRLDGSSATAGRSRPDAYSHETVAEPDDRFNLAAHRAELPAQSTDVHVHRACLDQVVVSPHTLEQPVA